ncbi:hypothetical protein SEVIR_5G068800v4 [Setaria viridis]|uniref:Uncharacterized protein n=1 Tax=Setaria viridis TaxID=4556 RepID=A0A4U6UGT8_SETVI|nr:hypothetical protein SEVIR_5G068800v2 [Setaria viridis]
MSCAPLLEPRSSVATSDCSIKELDFGDEGLVCGGVYSSTTCAPPWPPSHVAICWCATSLCCCTPFLLYCSLLHAPPPCSCPLQRVALGAVGQIGRVESGR